ncbi:hypothetical protein Slin_4839 [Spirosoma linguale DSM 74]|uniref:Uncharacterized protein n=1 Tax=Spirosoma linguale (strain ATCC 33905 / DSM 74 / LMG 10896 / Claus 1) TaxID=504472 RepID=D2QQN6_SPILD|nr:hypothetical protein Slin_4839 [Spirosoma linguale DSM 74]
MDYLEKDNISGSVILCGKLSKKYYLTNLLLLNWLQRSVR